MWWRGGETQWSVLLYLASMRREVVWPAEDRDLSHPGSRLRGVRARVRLAKVHARVLEEGQRGLDKGSYQRGGRLCWVRDMRNIKVRLRLVYAKLWSSGGPLNCSRR